MATGADGQHFHYDYSTKYGSASAEDSRIKLSRDLNKLHRGVTTSSHILITLGTAWVYHLVDGGRVVANCHRQPQETFRKALLTPDAVATTLARLVDEITTANPEAELIFTVSPVRHLRDGLIENQRSKAALLTGIHTIIDAHEQCHYFPAYEIMMDELRDYRWYADDMLHPSSLAVQVIYERFVETWCDEASIVYLDQWSKISSLLCHRPHHPDSSEAQQFIADRESKYAAFLSRYPWAQLAQVDS